MKVEWGIGGTLSERPSLYYLFTHQPEADRLLKQRYFSNQFQQFCGTSARNQGWKWKWKERKSDLNLGMDGAFLLFFCQFFYPGKDKKKHLTHTYTFNQVCVSLLSILTYSEKEKQWFSEGWMGSFQETCNKWLEATTPERKHEKNNLELHLALMWNCHAWTD